jgi:organic radical activating enzyme
MLSLAVSEIFYSLQGEGIRAGEPSIFVRLQGCSAKNACYASGVRCDTEFESGKKFTLDELLAMLRRWPCRWIVWTGGEPTDQLTDEVVAFFHEAGFKQAIETSGLHPAPTGLDWVAVSPKVADHVVAKNFPDGVDELRYIRHSGQSIPQPSVQAKHYLISPHFDGFNANDANVRHCIQLCLENPTWRLSIQQHKLLSIL